LFLFFDNYQIIYEIRYLLSINIYHIGMHICNNFKLLSILALYRHQKCLILLLINYFFMAFLIPKNNVSIYNGIKNKYYKKLAFEIIF